MAKNLSLKLTGEDSTLSSALNDVKEAAIGASKALKEVEDKAAGISDDMSTAAKAAETLESSFDELAESGILASSGISKQERSAQDAAAKTQGLTLSVENLNDANIQVFSSSMVASDGIDQLSEQSSEASRDISGLSRSINAESLSALAAVGPNRALGNSLDHVGDEAAEARNKMAGAASMAELLSLKSSALSINVGAFTIALRNLTTQVPLLVASLGNLAAAFTGLAGAIGAVGMGGFAVALGGAVGHAESIAGPMATMEEKMQAMQAIGEEFISMLNEAIEPLKELEGSSDAFISLLEEIATTVRVFSQSIADSWEDGPLRQAINTISDAWMESIVAIGDAFEHMVAEMQDAGLFKVFADGIRQIDDFVIFVTNALGEMMAIMGEVNENNALKEFITELMQVGRQVASGLAPLMNKFLEVVGAVAEEISALGSDTVGTIVQIVALSLAFNRLISMTGAVLQPLSLAIGHIGSIATTSKSATEAFTKMSGRMVAGLANISSGFGRFAGVMATAMPLMDPDVNNLTELGETLNSTGGPLQRLGLQFDAFSSKAESTFRESANAVKSFASTYLNLFVPVTDVEPNLKGTSLLQEMANIRNGIVTKMQRINNAMFSRLHSLSAVFSDDSAGVMTAIGSFDARIRDRLENLSAPTDIFGRIKSSMHSLSTVFSDDSAGVMTAIESFDARMTDRVENSDVLDSIERIGLVDGEDAFAFITNPLNSLAFAIDFEFGIEEKILQARERIIRATENFSVSDAKDNLRQKLLGMVPSLTGIQQGINAQIASLNKLTFSNAKAATTNNALAASFSNVVGASVIAGDGVDDLGNELRSLAEKAELSEDQIDDFDETFKELIVDGKAAGMTLDELEGELVGVGIDAELAERQLDKLGDEMTENSIEAGVLSTVTSGLTVTLSTLTTAVAALTAILAAATIIVGTVAAGLMLLGQSGKDAEGLISGLKETLREFGRAVLPFVVGAGNMMLGVFDAIMMVGKELATAFKEIGVALGLIDPDKAGAEGFMATLEGMSKSIRPVLEAIGSLARVTGVVLAEGVRRATNVIVALIDTLQIKEIISILAATVQYFADNWGGLVRILRGAVAILDPLIMGLLKIGAIIGASIGVVGTLIGVITVLNLGLAGTLGLLTAITLPISLTTLAIGALIAAVVILLEKFGILDTILSGIMGLIEGLINLIVGLAKAIGKGIAGIIDWIVNMWDKHLGGKQIIGKVEIPGIPHTDFDGVTIGPMEIPKLGGGGGDASSSGGGGGGGGDSGDLFSGLDTMGGIGDAMKAPETGGPAKGVEYNEGDTMNNFNQDISADPEDKAQIGRIAKDAMEEANSFARRRQGGQ